jgi:branched-chain amino acid transport system permease protein
MFNRECGVFKTNYKSDMALFPLPITFWTVVVIVVLFALVIPLTASDYFLNMLNLVMIAVVGAMGLNILMGYCGQISIGHAAFITVGAYAAAHGVATFHMPFWLGIIFGGVAAAVWGILFGIPSLRVKGLYLAIATWAAQLITEWIMIHVTPISGGAESTLGVPEVHFGSWVVESMRDYYYLNLIIVVIALVVAMNLVRSSVGRAFIAIRDRDIAAEALGINLFRYKLLAFAIASFYAGVTGAMYAYYWRIATYEAFDLTVSIDFLAMIIIGGMGSILGTIFGAAFITLMNPVLRALLDRLAPLFSTAGEMGGIITVFTQVRIILFGVLIILFLVLEPEGLAKFWRNIKAYFRVWPFSY